MKLRFKHQKFQDDAVKATCDIFTGQPKSDRRFLADQGDIGGQLDLEQTGFGNAEIGLSEANLIKNLHEVQRQQGLALNSKIERLNNRPVFTIEMETGTGKTYTYIKTMYELNARYGWCKFIVVVPSVAIREGVYKTFQTTAEHFAEDYSKKIRFFIYNSTKLNEIEQFSDDANINVMIINTQAFNSRGADSKRIRMKLDSFRSRRPIDIIAATKPIVVVDEPQSVLGTDKKANVTRETIAEFSPLFFLNYSATHREDFNKIYRLDAIDAYQKQLVKRIEVKGIEARGGTATNGYLYLQKINTYPNRKPTATVTFNCLSKTITGSGINQKTKNLERGDNIYNHSGEIEAYHDGYMITEIHAQNAEDAIGFIKLSSGETIYEGEVIGATEEKDIRRIQIRETITTHFQTEHKLYKKGIKVLSLFFIDEVSNYKWYQDNEEQKGIYAKFFEEEYKNILENFKEQLDQEEDADFIEYLDRFTPSEVHAGYFSIDKKGHAINSAKRKEAISNNESDYELIMKDKERLLSFEEPVRFIFSHSALREGWDNPNVFQICTLRESDAEIKKRQEIGRGLRLCVDKNGNRMDSEVLGENLVHDINILTVISSETYEKFAEGLQKELNESVKGHPKEFSYKLFAGQILYDSDGEHPKTLSDDDGVELYTLLRNNGVIDDNRRLSIDYRELPEEQQLQKLRDAVGAFINTNDYSYDESLKKIIDSVINLKSSAIYHNGRKSQVININREKYSSEAFEKLWNAINEKTYYTVNFNEDELINHCVKALDEELKVTKKEVIVTKGSLKSSLEMSKGETSTAFSITENISDNVKYDLIGELTKTGTEGTGLTRETACEILRNIKPETFALFQTNPEEFIHKATKIIRDQKANEIIEHIEYDKTNERWDGGEIFINKDLTGTYGENLIDTPRHHVYDKLRYDSNIEKAFAEELERQEAVEVYVKLPKTFYIKTPMGNYSPDWAIAFHDNNDIKHIYFVAETKGSSMKIDLKGVELAKIECAKKHFAKISNSNYTYGVCDSYTQLLELVNS